MQRAADGHFYLQALVNERPIEFLVDTGASLIVLSRRDAERIGIDTDRLPWLGTAMTANGPVETAPIRLREIRIGPIRDRDVPATVTRGALDVSLLGMSWLTRFARVSFEGNRLILER